MNSRTERKKRKTLRKLVPIILITFILIAAGTVIYIRLNYETEIDLSQFGMDIVDSTTRFYYCDTGIDHHYDEGAVTELDETLSGSRRILYVDYENIPQHLIGAFVAIEDKRFFDHDGVDLYRSAGAAANYILGFDDRFGASTITQQLIKNVTGNNEISIKRKLQEILWAFDLEKSMTKEEILTCYLNVINLSQGCYGVGAAANIYFSKAASELNVLESACIAAITNSPTYYDPIRNPENNKARRDVILTAMYDQGYLDEETYRACHGADVTLNVNEEALRSRVNSWYVDMVVEDVTRDLMTQYGYTRETASRMVYNGGLRIVTAMDPSIQNRVESYYRNVYHFGTRGGERAQSAMIVLHPQTGDVLGVAGAVGEKTANRVQSYATSAKRPSGSTIKPLSVYAPALEEGKITYSTVFDDVPVKFIKTATGFKTWPQNANMVYRGLTNVNYALANSLNTVAVKVLDTVGTEKSFSFLQDTLHIDSLIEREPLSGGGYLTDKAPAALALGQMNHGVTLREMTAAYTIFSDGGQYAAPRSYYKVYDSRGRELLSSTTDKEYAISSANACIMTKMLEHVISTGTAKPITLDNVIDVAGKTGTTQNNCDKWFIAYTPYCLCGVWYGYEYPVPIEEDEKNQYLDIWNDVMLDVHLNYYVPAGGIRSFATDKDVVAVTFCRDSGLLMKPECYLDPRNNRAEVGYFVKGTEPKRYCTCHIGVDYDSVAGGVICDGEPHENTTRVGLVRINRSFPMQIYVTDAQYTYRPLPIGQMPAKEPNRPYYATLWRRGEYGGISPSEIQFNHSYQKSEETEAEESEETGNDPDME